MSPRGPGLIEVYWWPQCGRIEAVVLTDSTTIQRPRDGRADALRRCLGLPVTDMGVAQRHARTLVTEQARDDRQWDALQNSVAGKRMTQIMQANILDPGLPAHRIPERQVG